MAYDPSKEVLDTKPWYKQFWPWFVIALPFASMLGSITTIYVVNSDVITRQDIPVTSEEGFVRRGMFVSRAGKDIKFLDDSLKVDRPSEEKAEKLISLGLEALEKIEKQAKQKEAEVFKKGQK